MIDNKKIWNNFLNKITPHIFKKNEKVLDYKSPAELKALIEESLTTDLSPADKLDKATDLLLKYSADSAHPQFFNQLFSGRNTPALMGEILSAVLNQSMYTYEMSPCATLIEKAMLDEMSAYAGFVNGDGVFTSGGSQSNLVALLVARNQAEAYCKQEGLFQSRKLVFYVSDQSHYSFLNAANILGLGLESLVKVATNERGEMLVEALEAAIIKTKEEGGRPFFVAATAGTTVRGAFDPVDKIGALAKQYGLWLHVDGAYGASALLSKKHRHLLKGIEQADSLTWDAHKMMGVPLMCSVIILNNKRSLLGDSCSARSSAYIFHGYDEHNDYDLGLKSLQCGRRADVIKLWFMWQALGSSGYEDAINHCFELARYASRLVEEDSKLTLIYAVDFCNVCFQYIPVNDAINVNEFNARLRQELLKSGFAMVNQAEQDGKIFLRLVTVNFNATQQDVTQFFESVRSVAKIVETSFELA